MPTLLRRLSALIGTLVLAVCTVAPAMIALPAQADEVTINCWCQKQSSGVCNHVERVYSLSYSQDDAFTAAHRDDTCNRCTSYCASLTDGPWRTTNCEPTYRQEICSSCTADPTSSCTEAMGARLSFSAAQDRTRQAELQAQCEAQTVHPIFPITLGTPIGGVTQVNGLAEYINVAYRYLVSVVLVVAIVMTVYGGFRYLFGASVGSVSAGKSIISDALIGMLIVLGAYTILATVNPATTILGLNPPTPISCQDLNLPPTLVHSRCASDTECAAGQRCVEAHNVVFDVHQNLQTFEEGNAAGASAGHDLATAINEASTNFVGDGHGNVTGFSPLDALINSYLSTNAAVADLTLTTAGMVVGGDLASAGDAFFQIRASANNIHLCSTGEQGSPCTEDRYCQAGLSCSPGWELCWPPTGNAPGMPCNPNVANSCSGGTCEPVPGTEMHVCQIQVRDSTPCFYPSGSGTVFPGGCGATSASSEQQYTCTYCPSGQHGEARVWTYLSPGMDFPGQCKPRAVLASPTNCAR